MKKIATFFAVATVGFLTAGLVPITLTADSKTESMPQPEPTWRGVSLTEFSPDESAAFGWQVVNDSVMGGRSNGSIEVTESGTMLFSGDLSLENNGGFSTFRSKDVEFDLGNDLGLLVRVKGDGRTYQARLATDARYRGMEVSFSADIPTTRGEWQQVKVPFSAFKGSFRGTDLPKEKLDPSKIRRIGILIGDKKQAPFELEIDYIQTYGKGQGKLTEAAPKSGSGPASIVDTVVSDGRFKTLATALTKAELLDVLQGSDPLTVFAPTDEAFAKVPAKLLEELLLPENKKKLIAVLSYHVSPGASRLSDALKAGDVPTVQGSSLEVTFAKGAVRVNKATLVDADLDCSNGVIHVIDSVLLPPEDAKPARKTILTVAEKAGNFSTLLAAIGAAELESVLEGDGPFTVFAPTEEAFAALPKGTVESLLKKENRADLAALLSYHVVSGKVSAGDALNAGEAKSLQGGSLKFTVRDGALKVNDSVILTTDIDGGNGVIHVIDGVLLPPKNENSKVTAAEVTANTKPTSSGAFEMIETAIEKGVPMFNSGDTAGCAAVYEACLEQLAESDQVDGHVQRMITAVMKRGEQHDSPTDRAWLYRSALDGMVAYLAWRNR